MAARLNRHHAEEIRQKIQASVVIDRFTKHLKCEIELSATQIQAGNSLLDRSVPKLQTIQHVGENGGAINHQHTVEWVNGKASASEKA